MTPKSKIQKLEAPEIKKPVKYKLRIHPVLKQTDKKKRREERYRKGKNVVNQNIPRKERWKYDVTGKTGLVKLFKR